MFCTYDLFIYLMIAFKKYLIIALALSYAGLFWLWNELPDGKIHLAFLDVGQGDATLMTTAYGHNILIDGGPMSNVLTELKGRIPFFMKEIDLMVLTHPHSDHLDGLIGVLKRYEVKNVLITGVEYNNSYYKEFLKDISARADTNVYFAQADKDFVIGGLYFDTIYPISSLVGQSLKNVNNSSIGFLVSFVGNDGIERKILLNGDNEAEVEKEILAEYGNKVESIDVFKASHHGSKTANNIDFLRKFRPVIVVIPCGEGNKFGHPHAESIYNFQQIGSEILRTDLSGTLEFVW